MEVTIFRYRTVPYTAFAFLQATDTSTGTNHAISLLIRQKTWACLIRCDKQERENKYIQYFPTVSVYWMRKSTDNVTYTENAVHQI